MVCPVDDIWELIFCVKTHTSVVKNRVDEYIHHENV